MSIQENVILAPYTTFKLGGPARYFCKVQDEEELVEAVTFAHKEKLPILVIGGGSNLLVSDSGVNGVVIKNEIKGLVWSDESLIKGEVFPGQDRGEVVLEKAQNYSVIEKNEQNSSSNENGAGKNTTNKSKTLLASRNKSKNNVNNFVIVRAGAGEDWEGLVKETVDRGLYGLEGLSAIPGTVGASPIQNIGAYGVDVSQVIESVRALDTTTMKFVDISNADCKFAYRDSIFKHKKGKYIVTAVTYKVSKTGKPDISYRDVKEYFAKKAIADPTVVQVREAVIEIRKAKLPDWTRWGTAGSFFKNPIITASKYAELKNQYPELPGFAEPDGRVKVSLGWILDKLCNAKGLIIGNVGTHDMQALVVVARPGATASEVMVFAHELMRRVKEMTGIQIEGEVEWAVV